MGGGGLVFGVGDGLEGGSVANEDVTRRRMGEWFEGVLKGVGSLPVERLICPSNAETTTASERAYLILLLLEEEDERSGFRGGGEGQCGAQMQVRVGEAIQRNVKEWWWVCEDRGGGEGGVVSLRI